MVVDLDRRKFELLRNHTLSFFRRSAREWVTTFDLIAEMQKSCCWARDVDVISALDALEEEGTVEVRDVEDETGALFNEWRRTATATIHP